jgi:PGF-CTERM protein
MEIASDDTFGELEVTTVGANNLVLTNDDDLTLSKDKEIAIAGNMFFKVADSDSLRYYPYAEYVIGGNVTEPTEPVTPGEETPVTPGEETPVTPGEETPVTPGEETPVEETPTNETETPDTPGFEAIFAVAGLLAVAYLVRRN